MTRMSDSGRRRKKSESATVNTTTHARPGRPAIGHVAADITTGNPLQLLIARRMVELGVDGKPLSLAQVVARSGKRGGRPRVSKPTVSNVVSGKAVKLQPDTVEGLAKALDLAPATIEAAISQAVTVQMTVPGRLQRLSPEAWHQLMEFGDYLLEREGKKR